MMKAVPTSVYIPPLLATRKHYTVTSYKLMRRQFDR